VLSRKRRKKVTKTSSRTGKEGTLKKALVMTFVLVLGLGLTAFAGPLTGTWDLGISIDPGATIAGDLFIDLSTSLGLTYTVGGWEFGSSSTFDTIGWSAQSFTASGTLGAFSFSSTMNFKPRTVTAVTVAYPSLTVTNIAANYWSICVIGNDDYLKYTYGAAFDDWTVTGSVSIAGMTFEGLFFLEGFTGDVAAPVVAYYWSGTSPATQTSGDTAHVLYDGSKPTKTGSGFRFMASGSVGDMTITSYTYFSLNEKFATVTCGQSLAKSGTYTVDGCDVGFTEEYLHIEGFSFGCATFEAGLDITCTGFKWVSFKASDLDLGLGWAPLVADFQVTFGETSKTAALCFDLTALETTCFTFGMTLDYSGTAINGVTIDSVTLEHTWNGISFSSETLFGSFSSTITDEGKQVMVLVPATGMTDAAGNAIPSVNASGIGYYDPVCLYTEKYKVWESFTIESAGDSCCGGAFDFSITTSFGDKYELDAYAYDYQFAIVGEGTGYSGALLDPTAFPAIHRDVIIGWLETGEHTDTATVTGGADVNHDGVVDAIWHSATDTKAAEQLKSDSLYEKDTQDQLFQWVSTDVDMSLGIGSAWSLTFGLDIDVYGWNALEFGFEFTF
jgi:hypothetical protein